MITKKNMGRASPLLLILLALVFGYVIYNLVTLVMNHTRLTTSDEMKEGGAKFHVVLTATNITTSDEMKEGGAKFHVVLTATNITYSKWQSSIMYYWYKRMRDQPQSDMGGFTRLLHSGMDDDLMDEIPTVVVDPLPEGVHQGYIVLNRPWAFVQWLEIADIEEEYILMTEPDYIFVNPLPNLAHGDIPIAYPFCYIQPAMFEKIIRKYYPQELGPVANVDPIRNSPVIIEKAILEKIAPTWMNVSLWMKNDPETYEQFGWVLEMYNYAVASALHGVRHILRTDLLIQGKLTFDKVGEWGFNKRTYRHGPPPKNLSLPPPNAPDTVVSFVKMVNEASANLSNWEVELKEEGSLGTEIW